MRTSLIAAAVAVPLALGACGTTHVDAAGARLVAASWPVRALLEELIGAGGSRLAYPIIDLAPTGVEPHDLELTADDRVSVEQARAVVYVGGGFQPSLERAIDPERDIDLLSFVDAPLTAGDDGSVDPHVWLDPGRWAAIARGLGHELSELDIGPEGIDAPELVAGDLEALDADLRDGLADCARREFFTEHAAFAYIADAYGLEQVALTGVSPEAEATAPRLQAAAQRARAAGATTVFTERGGEGRLATTLAEEAGGLQVAELDPLEFAFDVSETYEDRMRANLDALRDALECP
jgi:zinc transport system substrate-binding protein